jgi:hypothetical protein
MVGMGLSAGLVCLLRMLQVLLQVLGIIEGCVEVSPRLKGAGGLFGESSPQAFPELVPARRGVGLGRVLVFAIEGLVKESEAGH